MTSFHDVDGFQWFTVLLAAYGAILSTLIFFAIRADRRRIVRVSHSYGYIPTGSDISEQKLILTAATPREPVTLTGVGLRLPDGGSLVPIHAWPERWITCERRE